MFSQQTKSDSHDNDFFRYHSEHLWLGNGNDSMFSAEYNACYDNIGAIVSHLHVLEIPVLMVTEVVEYRFKPDSIRVMLEGGIEMNNSLMELQGRESSVPVVTLDKGALRSRPLPPQ